MNYNFIMLLLFLISFDILLNFDPRFVSMTNLCKIIPYQFFYHLLLYNKDQFSESAIIMYFNSVYYSHGNGTIAIYNPDSNIDDLSDAVSLSYNDTLQPTFDSYFLFNRLKEQITPTISNISIELSPIANPDQYNI